MAQRRMFSLEVCDTDSFLDMPASTQALYFHMGLRADDCGFVGSPRKITAMVNCSSDDLKLLIAKGYVIPFESGVCVIRHWRQNNYIQSDRFHETCYLQEKSRLKLEKSLYTVWIQNVYSLDTECIQDVSKMDTEVRIELGKTRLELGEGMVADKPPPRTQKPRFTPPSLDEVRAYCEERKNGIDPGYFLDYYTARGWKYNGGQQVKDWKACIRTWERNGRNKPQQTDRNRIRDEAEYLTGDNFLEVK